MKRNAEEPSVLQILTCGMWGCGCALQLIAFLVLLAAAIAHYWNQ